MSLLQANEYFLIRFDYKGPWVICQYIAPVAKVSPGFMFRAPSAAPSPVPGATCTGAATPLPPGMLVASTVAGTTPIPGYSYLIIRMPRRIGNPLQLTPGT